MVQARFVITVKGKIRSFTIQGHAESVSDNEYDPVCGTISALAQSIVNGIEGLVSPDLVTYKAKNGYLSAEIHPPKDLTDPANRRKLHDAYLLMEVLHLGLVNIEQGYPESLRVIDEKHT